MTRLRLVMVAAVASALAVALAVVVVRPALSSTSPPDTERSMSVRGCQVVASEDGYPATYIAQPVRYKIHPPLPIAGWRAPGRALGFQVLFHSIFHGYLVITYPSDLPAAGRRVLRQWVLSRPHDRVIATPTYVPGTAWIDAAVWGWELRCNRAVPTVADLDRFAARRTT